jgi:ribosomal protein S18 acetylase RimI-like enzyme
VNAATSELVIEHLSASHDRKGFDCGVVALNAFLQTQARKEMDRRSAVTYVLVDTSPPAEIIGYYSLSAATVLLDAVPEEMARRLGRQPSVPTTLMGRLAVSSRYQGQGLGSRLLWDALTRSEHASRDIGSVAVIVDAKDEAAAGFYERYGFRRFADPPSRLSIMMATIAAAATRHKR